MGNIKTTMDWNTLQREQIRDLAVSEINKFGKNDLIKIIEFVNFCMNYSIDEPFSKLINKLKSIIQFEFCICGHVAIENQKLSQVNTLENVSYPKEWMKIYFKRNYMTIDPILLTHFSGFRPLIWSQIYQKCNGNNVYEFLSISYEFGFSDGLTHGIFESIDSTGTIFSFSGPSLDPSIKDIARLELIIPFLHLAFIRFSRKKVILDEYGINLPLSEREIEILKFIKAGKTNWEISKILKISNNTVKFHTANVLKKLNASTRCHAVAKALELEIITL